MPAAEFSLPLQGPEEQRDQRGAARSLPGPGGTEALVSDMTAPNLPGPLNPGESPGSCEPLFITTHTPQACFSALQPLLGSLSALDPHPL